MSIEEFIEARLAEDRTFSEAVKNVFRVALGWYLEDDEMVMAATVNAIAAIWSDHSDYRQDWDEELKVRERARAENPGPGYSIRLIPPESLTADNEIEHR